MKSGDWFYEAVQYVYDKGMMTGVSADRFAPASTTTRGMIVTILYRLENEPAVSGGSAFTDVESAAPGMPMPLPGQRPTTLSTAPAPPPSPPTAPSPGSRWRRSCTGMPPTKAMT